MPPRRSTRASADPQSDLEIIEIKGPVKSTRPVSKRKREQSIKEEEEEPPQPRQSRVTHLKPSSTAAKNLKRNTRAITSPVSEGSEPEGEPLPKKPRNSDINEVEEILTGSPINNEQETTVGVTEVEAEAEPTELNGPVAKSSQASSAVPEALNEELHDPPISQPKAPPPEESQDPKVRLVIHRLVLVNFKSYAGRQEIGPFHKVWNMIILSTIASV